MYTLEESQSQADNAEIEQARQKFIQEIYQRRTRTIRFNLTRFEGEKRTWEPYVCKCRTWEEVQRWLNVHKVDWDKNKEFGCIAGPGFHIYRCH